MLQLPKSTVASWILIFLELPVQPDGTKFACSKWSKPFSYMEAVLSFYNKLPTGQLTLMVKITEVAAKSFFENVASIKAKEEGVD